MKYEDVEMMLIIDNYDSFTYNLVHIVAALGVDYRVLRNDELSVNEIRDLNPSHILISPGPGRPEDAGVTEAVIRELGTNTPILGVCLGHQAIGQVFGGNVVHAPKLMHGKTSDITHFGHPLFEGISSPFVATRYHSLTVDEVDLPDCLTITCRSEDGVVQGLSHKELPIHGIQFHPESILTIEGPKILKNWISL